MPEPIHNPTCRANHMGLWAIEPAYLNQAVAAIRAGTWVPRRAFDEGPPAPEAPSSRGWDLGASGIATIQVRGPMMKGWSKYADVDTLAVRRALREAVGDDRVKAILLVIDSPGGSAPGTDELAEDVLAADRKKPTYAYIEDLGASAAYWMASGARRISVNKSGEVGSIGVYAIVHDTSGAAKEEGVVVHVVATGPYKGSFADGAPVLPEHLAYLRERVQATAGFFFAAVKAGRGLTDEKLAAATDGRVFGAEEARKMGLVDRVETYGACLEGILQDVEEAEARKRAARARAKVAQSETGR